LVCDAQRNCNETSSSCRSIQHEEKDEMKIIVNGQAKNISEGIVLSSLLDDLKIDRERIAVEINLEIIKKDRYDSLKLVEGDRIEILQFVGGGESEPKE